MQKDNSRSLHQLKPGQTAQIKEIQTDAKMAEKLAAMGIARGQFITRRPGSSPVVVSVSGTELSPLRKILFSWRGIPMWAKVLFFRA